MATIVHEFRCDQADCRQRFDVITEVQLGPAAGIDVRCPHCGSVQKERAPGKIVKIQRMAAELAK